MLILSSSDSAKMERLVDFRSFLARGARSRSPRFLSEDEVEFGLKSSIVYYLDLVEPENVISRLHLFSLTP